MLNFATDMPLCVASLNSANFEPWATKKNESGLQRRENPSLEPFVSGCLRISSAMAVAYLDDQPNLEVSGPKTNLTNWSVGLIDKFARYRIFQKGRCRWPGGARITAVIDKLRFIF
jgi:hypothetical protein